MIRTFVEHFEFSADAAAIVASASSLQFSAQALQRWRGLRFTGDVSFDRLDYADPDGTVVALTGPIVEVLTLAGPINFLVAFVDKTAAMWSALGLAHAFQEPAFHGELPVYIESVVARALGFGVAAAFTSGKPGINHRPNGVVTMVGTTPFDRATVVRLWSQARRREMPAPRDSSGGAALAVAADDGLIVLDPAEAAKPWKNLEHFRNECSPYSGVEVPRQRADGKLLVDSYYGRAFDFELTESSAVYGFTDDLARVSQHADFGFLRVPYRCIPPPKGS